MGTQSLVAVIGFLVTFGVINSTMNKRNNLASDNTYGYVKYSAARDIARSAIPITLRKIDALNVVRDSDLSAANKSLDDGKYDVTGRVSVGIGFGADDTIRLVSIGRFSDSTYSIRTTLLRKYDTFPNWVMSTALGIFSTPDFSGASSGATIKGSDHDSSGLPIAISPDTVVGITVRTLLAASRIQTAIQLNNSFTMDDVIGNPKVNIDPAITNPDSIGNLYGHIADTILFKSRGNLVFGDALNFGSPSNPKIVFCNGDLGARNFAFQGEGWGILVVNGRLDLQAHSKWHGLVLVYGNPEGRLQMAGGSKIIGGVLLGGRERSEFQKAGNAEILFSKSALSLAKQAQKADIYTVVDWYE